MSALLVRFLLIAAMAPSARSAPSPTLSELYIVSVEFSDYGPAFYYRIVDLKQDGRDSIVQYVFVGPADTFCPRTIIKSVEARVGDKTPAELVGLNNPCNVKPRNVRAAVRRSHKREAIFESMSFGIVAHCGSSNVYFALPGAESVNLESLRKSNSALAGLWDLSSAIMGSRFGKDDPNDLTPQLAGAGRIPEIISGKYNRGLRLAVKENVGPWKKPSFRALLENYQGPVSAADVQSTYAGHLLNASSYRFVTYVAPKYPPLCMQARIAGNVDLRLVVDSPTGEVQKVSTVSGHPLLTQSALAAAKGWRFERDSLTSGIVNITVRFSLDCHRVD